MDQSSYGIDEDKMSEPSNADWELSKENVQPLRQGRNSTSLNTIFTVSKDEMSVQYIQEMQSFENNLMAYMGEDPLEIWIMYIKWIEDSRPQGGGPLLVSVLQKCIHKFCDDPRYVNDLRYLDVWNKHVRCCGNALEVYNYLYCNKIFSKASEFYIDWALELESSNNFKEANAVYDKGIRAEAEPKDVLLSHHQDFLVRMARNVFGNLPSPTDESILSGDHQRATLGLLKPKDNTVGVLRNETLRVNSGEIQSSSGSASFLKRNKPDFSICGDGNEDARLDENYKTSGFKPNTFLLPSCNKENVKKPGKWTTNRLRNERHVPVKGGNGEQPFEIHQDDTVGVEPRPVTSLDVLNSKKTDSASANILAIVNEKKLENRLQKVLPPKVIYGGITDVSFEELKAARWIARQEKIRKREEKLLKQREMYEEMMKQSRADILAEVKNLLKEALPRDHVTSENIYARIQQRTASIPSFDVPCASSTHEQSVDQCLRRADSSECFTPLCPESSIIRNVEIEPIPEKLVSPKISIDCDPLELCDIKPESEKFCIHVDATTVQQIEINTDTSPVEIPKVEGDVDDDVFINNENNENVPPAGYVQVRETGAISGILLPSTRVAYLPVDKNESDSEIEDVQPTHHLGSKNVTKQFEITSCMPTSTHRFMAELFIKSTPLGQRTSTSDGDCTVIPKCQNNEGALPQQCILLTEPGGTRSPNNVGCSTSTCRSSADAVIGSTSLEQRVIVPDGQCILSEFQEEDNKLPCLSQHDISLQKIPSAGVKEVPNCSVGEVTEPINGVYKTNPFNDEFLNNYLLTLESPLTCNENYTTVNRKLPAFKSKADIVLGNDTYTVKQISVAKGAFAKVHLATLTHLGKTRTVALKVQLPPHSWEYYISCEIESRMLKMNSDPSAANLFARITNAYIYNDGSVFVSNYCHYGNLLNLINAYGAVKFFIPESLTMYYAIELLDMIQKLHICKIIHADIKPDNILVQAIPQIDAIGKDTSAFFDSARSRPSLLLTDFGKSIDMLSLPPGTKFCYESAADGLLCPEMIDKKPWTYQPDYFGVASCIHCMLFGTYINIHRDRGSCVIKKKVGRCRVTSKVWPTFFQTLLNIPDCDNLPDIDKLRSMIQEDFIQSEKYKTFSDNTRELMCLLKGK